MYRSVDRYHRQLRSTIHRDLKRPSGHDPFIYWLFLLHGPYCLPALYFTLYPTIAVSFVFYANSYWQCDSPKSKPYLRKVACLLRLFSAVHNNKLATSHALLPFGSCARRRRGRSINRRDGHGTTSMFTTSGTAST